MSVELTGSMSGQQDNGPSQTKGAGFDALCSQTSCGRRRGGWPPLPRPALLVYESMDRTLL